MEWRRFNRLRTGQSYEVQGLIFFLSANYARLPATLQQTVRDCCEKAAGRSGNGAAVFEYMTQGRTKTQIMLKYYIASETSVDRMVRSYFREMERSLKELTGPS